MATSLVITTLDADAIGHNSPALIDLFTDVTDHGASIGYLPPLNAAIARQYWEEVRTEVAAGHRVVIAAWKAGILVGSAQLDLARRPNARHRAEVQKVMVHTTARQQGIGQALMIAIEREALQRGRILLVLDTWSDSPAERLYRRLGYLECGTIPSFAMSAAGTLEPTTIFYKHLPSE